MGICAAPHAAHGVNAAAVAGLDQKLDIGVEEVAVHADLDTVGKHESRIVSQLLDEAEDVVPASAVQSGRMVAQLVENLIHLEGRQDRFEQDGAAADARHAQLLLGKREDVVPQARFQVTLHLG